MYVVYVGMFVMYVVYVCIYVYLWCM